MTSHSDNAPHRDTINRDKLMIKILSADDLTHPDFRTAWDNLASHSIEANIFYSSALCIAASQHLKEFNLSQFFTFWLKDNSDDNPNISGTLVAIFPISPKRRYSRWPLPHIQNALHANCFLGTPLVWQGYEKLFWCEFFRYCDNEMTALNFIHFDKLSLEGPVYNNLVQICDEQKRPLHIVKENERAKLRTELSPDAYYAQNIRKKKRKEIQRLRNRLDELGEVSFNASLSLTNSTENISAWLDEFLALESAGWKGANGSSLSSYSDTENFYKNAMMALHENGQLHLSSMRLDGKPLAMLITLICGKTGFSFKTAFDENYARYSPGVLLQLENLTLQGQYDLQFIDSCAAENHPMIDRIWSERRRMGRVSISLSKPLSLVYFKALRFVENMMDKRNSKNNIVSKSEQIA